MATCPQHRSDFVGALNRVPRGGSVIKTAALLASLVTAGALTGESVISHTHTWLSWFALIPVFIAIRFLRPSFAAACGALWGFSIYAYCAMAGGAGFEPTLASGVLLTVAPAAYACFGAFATRRRGFDPLVLGLGWAAVEFALNPVGLRHGLLAAFQGDNLVLLLIGKMGGYVVVAFLVAFVSASILGAVTDVVCTSAPRSLKIVTSGDQGARHHLSLWFLVSNRYLIPSHPRAPPILA